MEVEKSYTQGFNAGFKLAEYQPELWEKLKPSLSMDSEYERGILEGAAEYETKKEKTRENDLENIRKSKDKDKTISKDR